MNKFLIFTVLATAIGLLLSCTTDIESAEDVLKKAESSSSDVQGVSSGGSSQSGSVFCDFGNGSCQLFSAEACLAFGQVVESCPGIATSSSSSAPPSSSSSAPPSSDSPVPSSSSSLPVPSSSSSLPSETVLCEYSGICLPVPADVCAAIGGIAVQSCPPESSSSVPPSSSSIVPSSNSVALSSSPGISSSSVGNVFIDPRDSKAYKFETAPNGRIWMSENLNYSRDNTLGYCYGVDINGANPHQDASGCNNGYGRVYEWATAIDGNSSQGLCPDGWHIPSTAEWSSVISTTTIPARIMSLGFYIYPGNYNVNSEYPPTGWKERDKSGFYWTSSGNTYFTGFWDGPASSYYDSSSPVLEAQTGASSLVERFSVRCIKDY